MSKHIGEFELGATVWGTFLVRDLETNETRDADDAVAYRVYGSAGLMPGGNGAATPLDPGERHIAGSYQLSFPVNQADGYLAGKLYTIFLIADVGGAPWADELTFRVI